jgi:hypothetical protein
MSELKQKDAQMEATETKAKEVRARLRRQLFAIIWHSIL